MTPQERQLVDELFARLSQLEQSPREPDAVAAINDGLRRAPNAIYALVQTVLLQEEALKQAQARIEQYENGAQQPEPRGFLDSMRGSLFGGGSTPQRSSVPSVGGSPWNTQPQYQQQQQPQAPQQQGGGFGGSFLGTAAAAAAGMVGGSLLMNSLSGMMGGGKHAFGSTEHGKDQDSSRWSDSGNSDLARDAGTGDIGKSGGKGNDKSADNGGDRQGLFDTAPNDTDNDDDDDFDGDDVGDSGGDSDFA
jgi:hypothetical protein